MALNIDPVTKDLVISAGTFEEVSGLTFVGQRIRDRIFTFRNEWFLGLDFGVPYLEQILGQPKPNLVVIGAIFKREMRKSLAGEAVLTSLDVKFDSGTRVLTVSSLITDPAGVEDRQDFIL